MRGAAGETQQGVMSVVMRTDSRLSVASPMVDGEAVDCSSLALPPPPLHAHPPANGMGVEAEVVGVTGSSGCEVERISPSQVTPVSSDTLSSSPDTQPGNTHTHPRPRPARAAHGTHRGLMANGRRGVGPGQYKQ